MKRVMALIIALMLVSLASYAYQKSEVKSAEQHDDIQSTLTGSPFTQLFKDGNYVGNITSKIPELNGVKVKMKISHVDNFVVADVYRDHSQKPKLHWFYSETVMWYPAQNHMWKWNDKLLEQTDYVRTSEKVMLSYAATAKNVVKDSTQIYYIDCKDKQTNDCSGMVDSRSYWSIQAKPDSIIYAEYFVPPNEKINIGAKAEKMAELVFTIAPPEVERKSQKKKWK